MGSTGILRGFRVVGLGAWEAREFGIGGFEVLQHAALQSGTSEELNVCDLFAWGFPVLGLWFKP